MDRAEATGFGVALAGHGALLAILSLGLANVRQPPLMTEPMEVSIVDEVALQSAVTEIATESPAPSVAPELGPPEEPAPAEEPAPPEPTPPRPDLVPPPPQPRPVPKAVIPPPPKPAAKPVPKPAAVKPAPAKPQPKPAPAKAAAKPAPTKVAPAKAAPKAAASPSKASGKGQAEAARGSRLGPGFLKGIGSDPSPATSQKATGAVMSSQAVANIGSAILRQVQPCANRQVQPGPGAERIRVNVNLRLNRDGSLAARPRVTGRTGVDEENRRYADRVDDLAIATFVGCSPLRGLPAELYNVRNGWSNFTLRYKLPG